MTDKSTTDIILGMGRDKITGVDYMDQIVRRVKNYEYRTKNYASSVRRVWFYEIAPVSTIKYICAIGPAHVRAIDPSKKGKNGEPVILNPLPEDGEGNAEYNTFHPDWDRYDFAYPVLACWRLRKPITLAMLKEKYDMAPPQGMRYVLKQMEEDHPLDEQELVWEL